MKVSVIVAAFKDESTLGSCLGSIRASEQVEFELIVVDDASRDRTEAIAREYADEVVVHPVNLGAGPARNSGAARARGEILVFVDSDVLLPRNALQKIRVFFSKRKEVDAITGLFAREHPNREFFSQYKNLYMHYIFRRLPERVTFVLGAIHAVRRDVHIGYNANLTADTDLGQRMVRAGKTIAFMEDLEVVHLKRYSFLGLLRNDFVVPFDWGDLFVRHRGWMQLGQGGTGYAHSPISQLVSIVLVPCVVTTVLLVGTGGLEAFVPVGGILVWLGINARFFAFLTRERGARFGFASVPITFLDQLVMAAGVTGGIVTAAKRRTTCFLRCRSSDTRRSP